MKYIGAHVSVNGGVSSAPLNANAIGAKAFALFTGNPSRWVSKGISNEEAELFKIRCEELGYTPEVILPHDNFLINLGSPDPKKLAMSRTSFLDEMKRCQQLGLKMLNFHPGSHLNIISEEECLDKIAESINLTLDSTQGVTAVIETTAGQGSNMGWDFAHVAHIIEKVEDKDRVGVCVDTCHTYSAGYDLKTKEGYERTWNDFDEIIGFKYLRGMHLNDDKKPLGSRVDRHELIGRGTIGPDFFYRLMNDPRFDNIPLILETPDELMWEFEIAWLYSQIGEKEVSGSLPIKSE
ncbi:MAG: deoxyribonuclease IV [Muribaculaceae bacterium]|nr:deoxyribonuclease IV [Muribaculaceae bacterium]